MKIIRLNPNPSGGYPSPHDWPGPSLPEGFVEIPADFDLTTYFEMQGFVTMAVVDDVVTAMTPNQTAKDANDAAYPVVEPTEPEPSVEDDMLETVIDHEIRLSELELLGGGE